MYNLYTGIATILFAAVVYYMAFERFKNERPKLALTLLILAGLAIRLFVSADPFLHPWDERYHALVAKNLSRHMLLPTLYDDPVLPYPYTEWTMNSVWLHKQPLMLWLMAISIKLFGCTDIAVRIPSIILSSLGVVMMYEVAKYFLENKKAAFLTAFLFSINGQIIELASGRCPTDHMDVGFVFFVLASIFFITRSLKSNNKAYLLFIGLSLGAAIITKWLSALIVIPVWVLLMLHEQFILKKMIGYLSTALIVTVALALPWQVYIHQQFPQEAKWESAYNTRHFYEVLETHSGTIFYHFDNLRMMYGELVYLPVLWFSYMAVKQRNFKWLAICVWFFGVFIFFSIAATKMPSYTLIAAPAIFMMTAQMYCMFKTDTKIKGRYNWFVRLVAFLLIALPVRYAIERIKPFAITERTEAWAEELKEIKGSEIDDTKTVLFGCEHYIEAMYYTDCIAYPGIPDDAIRASLTSRGYKIVVLTTVQR